MEAVQHPRFLHPRAKPDVAQCQAAVTCVVLPRKMKANRRLGAGTLRGMVDYLCPELHRRLQSSVMLFGSHGGCFNWQQPTVKIQQDRRPAKDFVIGQASMGWAALDKAGQSCQQEAELGEEISKEEREERASYVHTWPRAESLPRTRSHTQLENGSESCDSKSTAIKGFNGTSSKHRTRIFRYHLRVLF